MRTKTNQDSHRNSRGFSLLELLIVVAVIGIIASLAMINAQRANALAKEQLAVSKLHQIAELQTQFKVTLGRHRYGTLDELRQAQTGGGPLMSPTLAPVDKDGQPLATGGWLIQDQPDGGISAIDDDAGGIVRLPPVKGPPTIVPGLTRSFGIQAVPVNPTTDSYTYCIFEDGIVRRAKTNNITPVRGGLDTTKVSDNDHECLGCYIQSTCTRTSEQVPNQ